MSAATDPALAAVARYRRAAQTFNVVADQPSRASLVKAAGRELSAAHKEIGRVTPTTLAGGAALLRWLVELLDGCQPNEADRAMLRRVADLMTAGGMSTPDPVFGLLEEFARCEKDESDEDGDGLWAAMEKLARVQVSSTAGAAALLLHTLNELNGLLDEFGGRDALPCQQIARVVGFLEARA